MKNDDTATIGQPISVTTDQGAAFGHPASSSGEMCQQGQDWSRGTACIPQKFVRLVGHRDPIAPAVSTRQRRAGAVKSSHVVPDLSDTPIG